MSPERKCKRPVDPSTISPDEVAAALREDATVAALLQRARTEPSGWQATEEQSRRNAEFMRQLRIGSARAFSRRVGNKDLITKAELVERLGNNPFWANDALRAGRLFSLPTPANVEYFPAFFVDARYDRKALGEITQALEALPDEAKYLFFIRPSSRLQMTPLEALAQGRTPEVMACAKAFASI